MTNAQDQDFIFSSDATVEQPNDSKTVTPRRRFTITQYLVMAIILVAAVASNWPYQYHRVSSSVGIKSTWMVSPNLENFSMAGWPLKYFLKVGDQASVDSVISYSRLIANLLIWGFVFTSYVILKRYRMRRVQSSTKWTLRIADGLMFMVAVAVVLFYFQMLNRRAAIQRQFAQKVRSQGGFCSMNAFLPTPLKSLAGLGLDKACERISVVQLVHPTNEQIQQVLDLPQLQGIYLLGGDYDLRLLDQFLGKPLLRNIGVGGRRLDAKFVSTLSQMKQLSVLCLPRTNVTRQGLEALGEMPRLRVLGLAHTDVQFDSETAPPWSKNLEEIQLPRPTLGQSAKHIVDGWPKLRLLDCLGGAEGLNESPTELVLRNLPALEKVNLDVLQVFDLTLDSVPNALEILGDESERQRVSRKSDYLPRSPQIRKINAKALADNSTLTFDLSKIQSAKFEECNGATLRVVISDTDLLQRQAEAASFNARNVQISPTGQVVRPEIPKFSKHELKKLIGSLANSEGPENLLIGECDMTDVDWAPLGSNNGLKRLNISSSLTPRNIQQLEKVQGLEELSLPTAYLEAKQLKTLLSKFSNLKSISFPSDALTRLELVDLPNIVSVISFEKRPPTNIREVMLRNLPSYSDYLLVAADATQVQIENVPELSGLYFLGPCPKETKISGLDRLKCFYGGGANLTDEAARAVLECKTLEKLTLAHCNLSEETLLKITELPNLSELYLTGTTLTEAVIAKIAQMDSSKFVRLRLDQTGAVGKDLEPLIAKLPTSVRELCVDEPTSAIIDQIPRFVQLTSLGFRKSTIDLRLANLLDLRRVWAELFFDDCTVNEDALNYMASNRLDIRLLSLRNSQVAAKGFANLASITSRTRFDVEGIKTDSSLIDRLQQSYRTTDSLADFGIRDTSIRVFTFAGAQPQRYLPRKKQMTPMIGNDGQVIEMAEDEIEMEERVYKQPFLWGVFLLLRDIAFWNRTNQFEPF
ncbi:MAG: hypothetical protein U0930_03175 [Pirellulales bacterium]